jgi:bifunctional ADP-heptose synthase (sugar kinase/adenylyltransferase)
MKILVIGESCRDIFHYGTSSRLCPEAPVPVFKATNKTENGGMAKNVQNNLSSFNICTDIITNKNWEFITKTRFVDYRTNHMFLRVDENDTEYGNLSMETLKSYDLKKYDGVIVSDYNKGFLSIGLLMEIPKLHKLVFLDTKKTLGDWSENYSFIKINNKEYEATKHTITKKIKKRLIITRGSDGSTYRDETYNVPAVEVKDTSGAGDTFISAFAKRYIETNSVEESIKFANNCSTRVVQKRGVSVCD